MLNTSTLALVILALILIIVLLLIEIAIQKSKHRVDQIIYKDNLENYRNKAMLYKESVRSLDGSAGLLLTIDGCTMVSFSEIQEIIKKR